MIQYNFCRVEVRSAHRPAALGMYFLEPPTIFEIKEGVAIAQAFAAQPMEGDDPLDEEQRQIYAEQLDIVAQLANVLKEDHIKEALLKGKASIIVATVTIGEVTAENNDIYLRENFRASKPVPQPQAVPANDRGYDAHYHVASVGPGDAGV